MTVILEHGDPKGTKLFSEAVKLTGYGIYNIYILLATGGCLMCVIIETMCMSFIIPAASCDLNLSLSEKGLLASISFLGVLTTSQFWGFMADYKGRKNMLVFSLITSSLISLVGSIVKWSWLFILLRFLNGSLIGGASSIIYAYAGEFHCDKFRPMVISWISSFVAGGQMYIPGMAWAILPNDWRYYIEPLDIEFRPWRLLLIIYALPSLVVAAMLSILPESPKFLLTQGKSEETVHILRSMFAINKMKNAEDFPVTTVTLDEVQVEQSKNVGMLKLLWQQTVALFSKGYLVKTILLCYLQFGVFLSASALFLWFPEILNSVSRYSLVVHSSEVTLCGAITDSSVTGKMHRGAVFDLDLFEFFYRNETVINTEVCDDTVDTGVFQVILSVGAAIGITYLIIGILINYINKKVLLICVATITGVCGLTAQYISGHTTVLVLTGIYLLISSCIGVINALAVDLYPTNIRAMAIAVSLMFGRLGAMAGSNVVGAMFYNYCQYMFIMFAVDHILLIISAVLLPTKKLTATSSQ